MRIVHISHFKEVSLRKTNDHKETEMLNMATTRIHELLLSLGIGRQYLGHNITAHAIGLVIQDENCLLCVKQGIFLPLAALRDCDWRTIERNMRTVIHRAWTQNADRLSAIAVYPLKREPTVTEFLDILSSYLLRQSVARVYR